MGSFFTHRGFLYLILEDWFPLLPSSTALHPALMFTSSCHDSMSASIANHKRKRSLITYSRKLTRPPRLDGLQCSKSQPAVATRQRPEEPLSSSAHNVAIGPSLQLDAPSSPTSSNSDAASSLGENHSADSSSSHCLPDTLDTVFIKFSRMHRLPIHRLPLALPSDVHPSAFASPLSDSECGEDDTIAHDQTSGNTTPEIYIKHRRDLCIPLSAVRRTFKLSASHRVIETRTTSQAVPDTWKGEASLRNGFDGFTDTELAVPPRTRKKRRSNVPKSINDQRSLNILKGPSPDVDFITPVSLDSMLYVRGSTSAHENKMTGEPGSCDQEAVQAQSEHAGIHQHHSILRRKVSFNDNLVYAQLSSIRAPRRSESPITPSSDCSSTDDSDHVDVEEYQSILLRSDHSEDGQFQNKDAAAAAAASPPASLQSHTSPLEAPPSKPPAMPGRLPLQLLRHASRWISVSEDILDDGPPARTVSISASRFSSGATAPHAARRATSGILVSHRSRPAVL